MSKFLILLELNEINFDYVRLYINKDLSALPSLRKLLSFSSIHSTSEASYDELEPWIQWPSVHTCMKYHEHGIFRLGDVIDSDVPQIFEQIEGFGYRVGAICAMNSDNRLMKPAYFIPDPWTKTSPDDSFYSKALSQAISQTVNDNSKSKITFKSAFYIFLAFFKFARLNHYLRYLRYVLFSKWKPWFKPLFLDLLLHDVHWSFFKNKNPNFSTMFLNAGAHIQHHYFFNAGPIKNSLTHKNPTWYVNENVDPLSDALELYDLICGEYIGRNDTELIIATGLSQKPYDRIKFYYRLRNHEDFLKKIGISFTAVHPRMTRDFLVEFPNELKASEAQEILKKILVQPDETPLFGIIENRGSSLFVTLTYSNEIKDTTKFVINDRYFALKYHVTFVAIKNGMHQGKGFAFFTPGIAPYAPKDGAHVSELGKSIMCFFGHKN